jgi:hypothetical protein
MGRVLGEGFSPSLNPQIGRPLAVGLLLLLCIILAVTFHIRSLNTCQDVMTRILLNVVCDESRVKERMNTGSVGFEVFTAVVMKSIIFWDMTPCSLLSFNRRFGGTYRLHLQGRRIKFSKKPASKHVPPKRWLKLNGLHGVISQKMILFITTAVKTSNSTLL